MSQLRRCLVSGRWVIISPKRDARPVDFQCPADIVNGRDRCPFCLGQEEKTPPPVMVVPGKPGGPWLVRVVPNKYPALEGLGDPVFEHEGIYQKMPSVGVHEVIVEGSDHDIHLRDLSQTHAVEVIRAYIKRLRELSCDKRIA